jgi:hypothetical protein
VEHHVWSPEELRLRVWVLLLPRLEAFGQFEFPFRDVTPFTPSANLFRLEGDKDALAAIFYGGNPADLIGQRSSIHADCEFTIYVVRSRFEAREPDQRNYFAQPVDENDTINFVQIAWSGGSGRQRRA